jgi:Protein of unknown function, DUF481
MRFGTALCLALLLLSKLAHAQVNAEVLRPNPMRVGWSGGIDGSLAIARGNIELLDVGGGGRVQYQTLHPNREATTATLPFIAHRVFLTVGSRFAERADSAFINQQFVHARWTYMWYERIGSDLFAQYQSNEFLRLQDRAVSGTGVRIEIVHTPGRLIWGGSGYMFEYNRITVLPGSSDPRATFEHRWTNYLTARLALCESRLLLQNTFYYQPRFNRFADFRGLEELELLLKVTEAFAMGATLSVLHDSDPPTGVKKTDLRMMNTVRLSF